MKNYIILPILYNTEESAALADLGIKSNQLEFRDMRFYTVLAVAPATGNDYGVQSLIYIGDIHFECQYHPDTVDDLIQRFLRKPPDRCLACKQP
jgi:hypothetical protein